MWRNDGQRMISNLLPSKGNGVQLPFGAPVQLGCRWWADVRAWVPPCADGNLRAREAPRAHQPLPFNQLAVRLGIQAFVTNFSSPQEKNWHADHCLGSRTDQLCALWAWRVRNPRSNASPQALTGNCAFVRDGEASATVRVRTYCKGFCRVGRPVKSPSSAAEGTSASAPVSC